MRAQIKDGGVGVDGYVRGCRNLSVSMKLGS